MSITKTSCATVGLPTYWKRALICERFRSYSAIEIWRRPRSISTYHKSICTRLRTLSTNCLFHDALKQALDNLKAAIAETGAVITGDYLPPIFGQEAHMVQVFQNLISNAIKYRSEAVSRVQIHAQKNEREWILSVRDNGIGIQPEYQATIFGLFKRLHGREIPGTGMGLAICTKIIERHGGRLWVTSQPAERSEFFFSLPVQSE